MADMTRQIEFIVLRLNRVRVDRHGFAGIVDHDCDPRGISAQAVTSPSSYQIPVPEHHPLSSCHPNHTGSDLRGA
jgi:hypothetical protein